MKKWLFLCSLLLVVQVGLAIITNMHKPAEGSRAEKGPLLKIAASEVTAIVLEDGEGHKLHLKKEKDRWLLPDAAGFPADSLKVQGLLDRLAGLQRGWPEATTSEAANRFKVAADHFERKCTLQKDGSTLGIVYFGSSPGLRKMYIRADGDRDIQTLAMGAHELEVQADSWIDTRVLQLKAEHIREIDLLGIQLKRQQDGLQPADMQADEELMKAQRDALVKRIANLTISAALGKEVKPEYGLSEPALQYSVTLEGGGKIDYVFGQPSKGAGTDGADGTADRWYVLKVSGQEQLFRVDGWQVEEIKKSNRTSLVKKKGNERAEGKPSP